MSLRSNWKKKFQRWGSKRNFWVNYLKILKFCLRPKQNTRNLGWSAIFWKPFKWPSDRMPCGHLESSSFFPLLPFVFPLTRDFPTSFSGHILVISWRPSPFVNLSSTALSLLPPENLSSSCASLSLSPMFLSLPPKLGPPAISLLWLANPRTSRPATFKQWRNGGLQLASHGNTDVSSRWSACKSGHGSSKERHPLASFGGHTWSQHAQLTFFVIIVPSIHDESAWIIGTLFRTN